MKEEIAAAWGDVCFEDKDGSIIMASMQILDIALGSRWWLDGSVARRRQGTPFLVKQTEICGGKHRHRIYVGDTLADLAKR